MTFKAAKSKKVYGSAVRLSPVPRSSVTYPSPILGQTYCILGEPRVVTKPTRLSTNTDGKRGITTDATNEHNFIMVELRFILGRSHMPPQFTTEIETVKNFLDDSYIFQGSLRTTDASTVLLQTTTMCYGL